MVVTGSRAHSRVANIAIPYTEMFRGPNKGVNKNLANLKNIKITV